MDSQAEDEDLEEAADAVDNLRNDSAENKANQFFVHSEAIEIKDGHLALVSVEKLSNNNLQIKLHDMKQMASISYILIKKTNGDYYRLPPKNSTEGLHLNEDFRTMVFDLLFAPMAVD